jgi:hypothetical protein
MVDTDPIAGRTTPPEVDNNIRRILSADPD